MQFRLIPPSGGPQTDRRAHAGSFGTIVVFSRAGGSEPSSPGRFNPEDSTPTGMIMQDRTELSGFFVGALVGARLCCGSRLQRLSRPGIPRGKKGPNCRLGRVKPEDSTPTGMIMQDRTESSGFFVGALNAAAL